MPKHEPEVLAAIRRRKPLGRVVIDDDFAGTADGEQVLCCPRCGYQYMHSGKIYTSCDSKAVFHPYSIRMRKVWSRCRIRAGHHRLQGKRLC